MLGPTSQISSANHQARPHRATAHRNPSAALEYPKDEVELARNDRPVVLLHGTLVEKESISAYRDYALKHGHPVNYRDYPSITQGRPIEQSGDVASRQINRSRMELADRNLARLEGADDKALAEFFELSGDLYGRRDADVDSVQAKLPSLLASLRALLSEPRNRLEETFSGKLKSLEASLNTELQGDGIKPQKSQKIAAELLDSVAPKAIVVGHSAGGYVGYAMTVNPETVPDNDPFTYDGGNGIAEMVVLSAPIGAGLPVPAPPGILDLGFYNVDANVLRPVEQLPVSQLAMLNPFFSIGYQSLKNLTKQAYQAATHVSLALTSPLIHLARPGNAQVEEGSDFFNRYLKDKKVPDGVSVIAVTSPLDMLSQEARSQVDATQPNAHNFSADLNVSQADIERERPTWAHVIMTEQPDSFQQQFAHKLASQPEDLKKLLDPSNDDGTRYEALQMVAAQLQRNPALLDGPMKTTLTAVASERAPFKDSPSYLAHQLLQG